MRLKLKLQSPLLAVGTLRTGNFYSSLDYLPGGVLRAALALALLENGGLERRDCDKLNWVPSLNAEERARCKYPHLFDEFSKMRIGDATLYGSRFAPMTAYICKSNPEEHPVVDCLDGFFNRRFKRRCVECNGPVDRFSGWLLGGEKVAGIYRAITRTAINSDLGVAADEKLFTCHCLETYCQKGKDEEPTELHAMIRCSPEAAEEWKGFFRENPRMYAGRYTSSGLGAMDVETDELPPEESLEARLISSGSLKQGRLQVPLTAWSDIYLPLENPYETTGLEREEEMKKRWAGLLELPEGGSIARCFTNYKLRGGFSTMQKGEKWRKAKWIVAKGSVFVLDLPDDQASRDWLKQAEEKGLGDNTEHGFGRVLAADPIHRRWGREEHDEASVG
ncbi:MAG: hypothetical protein K6U80_04445 [Firmicutes bacterium]|nr:hypothetical protein [Bacillota bacterium]